MLLLLSVSITYETSRINFVVKTRFRAGLLSYFTSVALSGTGLTNEKKNKFSVRTIKSSLILENIIGFDGLINIDRVVASE